MPKCPRCKEEIDSVNYTESGLIVFSKGEWIKDENPDIDLTCPNCGEKVALDMIE